jgi:M6 family metalloprotease-like protein
MDTRGGNPTIDGLFAGAGQVGQASSVDLTVVGRGGVPASGVGAVALNVTVTNPTNSSFLTVWPTGAERPLASNLNFVGGQTIPNMVIVPVGAGGQVSFYNNTGGVDVVVDVLGWFPTGASYTGLTPARQMDTRIPDAVPAFPVGPIRNLLVARPALHQMSGNDRIAVYVCDVPTTTTDLKYSFEGPTRLNIEPRTVARWAQREVAPYFDISSGGHFETTFVALGHIPLANNESDQDCLDKATAMTGRPFTNVLVTDNTLAGDGFGGPGIIFSSDSSNPNRFDDPPSITHRGSWVGGGSTSPDAEPSAMVVAHEIGHSLHWPHSFTGPGYEYDNPIDVMSGQPADGWCEKPDPSFGFGGTLLWPCHPTNTLAFNRFAAGWIDDTQVQLQTGGTNTFTLDAPAGAGTEMVAAPDPSNAHVMLTLEARPKVGFDQFLGVEGVAVHMIDQRPGSCFSFISSTCISTDRRQRPQPARTDTDDYAHVLQLGTTTVVDGLTISVLAHTGNTFTVQVSGTFFAPPAQV